MITIRKDHSTRMTLGLMGVSVGAPPPRSKATMITRQLPPHRNTEATISNNNNNTIDGGHPQNTNRRKKITREGMKKAHIEDLHQGRYTEEAEIEEEKAHSARVATG